MEGEEGGRGRGGEEEEREGGTRKGIGISTCNAAIGFALVPTFKGVPTWVVT